MSTGRSLVQIPTCVVFNIVSEELCGLGESVGCINLNLYNEFLSVFTMKGVENPNGKGQVTSLISRWPSF